MIEFIPVYKCWCCGEEARDVLSYFGDIEGGHCGNCGHGIDGAVELAWRVKMTYWTAGVDESEPGWVGHMWSCEPLEEWGIDERVRKFEMETMEEEERYRRMILADEQKEKGDS